MWRGENAVMAVPSLLIYTTGIQLLTMHRIRHREASGIDHVAATSEALRGLTADGRPVELLGGRHTSHGFTYSAWVRFYGENLSSGVTFNLKWPGMEPAAHRVGGLTEAHGRVTVLWSESTE
jgi:hypothetical protein